MRKIQACIGFDPENLEWLKHRDEPMSSFLNNMVTLCREKEPLTTKPQTSGELAKIIHENEDELSKKELLKSEREGFAVVVLSQKDEERQLCFERIEKALLENPYKWLLKVYRNKSTYNKALRLNILNEVQLECGIKPTESDVADIFWKIYKAFDFSQYEREK